MFRPKDPFCEERNRPASDRAVAKMYRVTNDLTVLTNDTAAMRTPQGPFYSKNGFCSRPFITLDRTRTVNPS